MSFWSDLARDINWGDVVKAGIGLYTSNKARNAATTAGRAAQSQEDALLGDRIAIARRQGDIANLSLDRSASFDRQGNQLVGSYLDTTAPLRSRVNELATRPIDPNVEAGLAAADYAAADAAARGTLQRQQAAAGIAPNSGAALEQARLAGLSSVAGKAGAMTAARQGATDKELQRLGFAREFNSDLASLGTNYLNRADSSLNSAVSALTGAGAGLRSVSDVYGERATQAGAQAGAAGAAAGDALSDLVGGIIDKYGGKVIDKITGKSTTGASAPAGAAAGAVPAAGAPAAGSTMTMASTPGLSSVGNYTFTPGYQFLGGPAAIPSGLQNLDYSGSLQDYATSNMDSLNARLNADPNMRAAGGPGLSNLAQGVGGALGIYSGLKQGGVMGGLQTASGAAQLASAAGYGGSTLSSLVPGLGAVTGAYGTLKAIQAGDTKSAAASGAATGAAVGSIVPGIGTAVGAVIGGIVGGIGSLIHGKDYKEEEVRDKYYDAVKQGMTWDTSEAFGLSPEGFYQSMAGEFRGSRSKYPPRASGKYGQKDEDVFVADLANKINSAYAAGVIGPNDNAETIMQKVVEPWFQQEMGGWRSDPRYPTMVQEQKTLTMDLINRYIHGEPVEWAVIKGGSRDHPVPQYAGLSGAGASTPNRNEPIMSAPRLSVPQSPGLRLAA